MSATGPNRIELRLRELAQLFNLMDPSPFYDRDLDAAAEEFIVSWAGELSSKEEIELVVHLATAPDEKQAQGMEEAVRHYFANRADMKGRELRHLLRRGRVSLLIGFGFLAVCFALAEIGHRLLPAGWNEFSEMGLQIVGWVAMWRPLEIFLYDWWPIRKEQQLLERLGRMRVRLQTPPA
jgi:hypothetical protein